MHLGKWQHAILVEDESHARHSPGLSCIYNPTTPRSCPEERKNMTTMEHCVTLPILTPTLSL